LVGKSAAEAEAAKVRREAVVRMSFFMIVILVLV
jgi:hypothetical protein